MGVISYSHLHSVGQASVSRIPYCVFHDVGRLWVSFRILYFRDVIWVSFRILYSVLRTQSLEGRSTALFCRHGLFKLCQSAYTFMHVVEVYAAERVDRVERSGDRLCTCIAYGDHVRMDAPICYGWA